ncbi:iron-siderophore ABC transporter substrate-binding protein [Kribbella endophytica]
MKFPLRIAVAVLLTASTLVACGTDAQDEKPVAAGVSGRTAVEDGALPTTVEHKFGSTEVKADPQRVVTVGLVEQDPLLALGIVPVGTTEWFGERPGALYPWAEDRLKELNGATPTVLKGDDGIQFERVAALRPDLIIALYADLSQSDYTKLSQIAPTIAPPKGVASFGIGWEDAARTVGKAVGRPAAADKLVKDAEKLLADARAANPKFEGATALVAAAGPQAFVYGPDDPRTRLMASLGFKSPANLRDVTKDQFGVEISNERLDLLDVDALVMLVEDQNNPQEAVLKSKLYTGLNAVKQGRVAVSDYEQTNFAGAFSFLTVLSVKFITEGLVPQLTAAVDGDPATKVPSAPKMADPKAAATPTAGSGPAANPPTTAEGGRSSGAHDPSLPSPSLS